MSYNKLIVMGLLFGLCSCGGGGGGLTCSSDKPLLCSKAEGCCARGLPYSCDGLCYSGPVAPCVESDFCTFNVKGLILDDEGIRGDPAISSEVMSSPE